MKRLYYYSIISLMSIILFSGCKKYLDVNINPNAPQEISPNLYLGSILDNMAMAPQWDGRFIGKYSQMWSHVTALDTWDRMGYADISDNNGEMWRAVYWLFGHNLENMIRQSNEEQRWDLLGIGYILKAWGWQQLTELHGEIIVKQAYDLNRTKFDYDSQDFVYEEVERLLLLGIQNLEREDGAISASYIQNGTYGDQIYKGERAKWKKFAYGLLAMNRNNLSNKRIYDPLKVIEYAEKSFESPADDALFTYQPEPSTRAFFYSPIRNNFANFRQTEFIVNLLNGSQFGGVKDPRLSRMLAWSTDSTEYNGLIPTYAPTFGAGKQPMNLLQYTVTPTGSQPGKYIFVNNSTMPILTYFQLQFIKAEAAFLKGDKQLAWQSYKKGVETHLDFVNTATTKAGRPGVSAVTAAERQAFLSSNEIIPTDPEDLTLSHIMSQKYISQWGWAYIPTWTDLRRYHYEDLDPDINNVKVFRGFTLPTSDRFSPLNLGKPAYRSRPRYNSEYIWNVESLQAIGGMAIDYHTKMMWLFEKD